VGVSAIPPERPLIIWHLMETPPPGYIKANGAEVSREAYAWLFSKIGTKYGAGDGVTTFVAGPDMRGEFQRGWDDGRGVDPGRVNGSGQLDAIQGHGHLSAAFPRWFSSGGNGAFAAGSNMRSVGVGSAEIQSDGVNGDPRIAAETRPRNVAGLFCIAIAP
jgi:phage-related tail fiber protein